MLYEIQPEKPLATLLKTFREVKGVIDYVLIGGISSEQDPQSYECHKKGAVFTVEAACTRYRSREKGPASRREPDNIQGKLIYPTDFFAPGYTWIPIDEIATFPRLSEEQRAFYQASRNVQLYQGMGYYFHNYHYAFRYTPHGLARYEDVIQKLSEQEVEQLFSEINNALFGDEKEAVAIYSWSTDWADYFNEGHEWWGSFLWTVYSSQTNILVGIAASTSD